MAELEARNKWDGSWYDLDAERSSVIMDREARRYGLKVVYQ